MTAWLGFSSNLRATCWSSLLSKNRTPATVSMALPNGSAIRFLCPTLSAKLGLLSLAAGGVSVATAGGSAVGGLGFVCGWAGGRFRDDMMLSSFLWCGAFLN